MKFNREHLEELTLQKIKEVNYHQTEAYQKKLGRMVFDRDKLEELTRKKIAEVNEETGYRVYFEVPEMVELVAQSIEEMLETLIEDGN